MQTGPAFPHANSSGDHHAQSGAPATWSRAWLVLPSVVALAASLPVLGGWVGMSPDSFKYLGTARWFWETGGFPPERLMLPPGFPLLLAPAMAMGDTPLAAMRLLLLACFVVTPLTAWLALRGEIGQRAALAAALMTATSSLLLAQSTMLLSEAAYLPLWLACVYFACRWQRHGCTSLPEAALGGLTAAAATMVRSMGIIVLPIMLAVLLARSKNANRSTMTVACVWLTFAAGPVLAWQARQAAHAPTYDYGTQWTQARELEETDVTGISLQATRLMRFGPMRLADIKAAMLPQAICWRAFHGPLGSAATLVIGLGIVLIALWRLAHHRTVLDAIFLATIGMLALWPWDEGPRLVSPLVPIMWGYAAWFIARLWMRPEKLPSLRWAVAAVAGVGLCAHLGEIAFAYGRLERQRIATEARWRDAEALAVWQAGHLSIDACILGVTGVGHNDKLVLAGASYLSRRRLVGFYEVGKSRTPPAAAQRAQVAIVQSEVSHQLSELGELVEIAHVGGFRVFDLRRGEHLQTIAASNAAE